MNNMNHRNAVHNVNSSVQTQYSGYTGSDREQTDEHDHEDQNTAQSKVNFIAKQYIR